MRSKQKKTVERRSNAERSSETKNRILEATLACLAEEGYAATSTNDVVKRAGVSRGALMHHFASKSELVAAAAVHLIRKRHASTHEQSLKLSDEELSIHEKLTVLRRDYERWFPETIEFMVACRTNESLSESFNNAMRPYQDRMEQSILKPWPELAKHDSPLLVQYVLGCFIRGLCLEAIVNPESLTDEIFDEFVNIISAYAKCG